MKSRLMLLWLLPVLLMACNKQEAGPVHTDRLASTLVIGASEVAGDNIFSGEVHARREAMLGFRIGGKITARLVDAGSVVKAGQVLAQLDPADTSLQESAASAQHRLAEEELKRFRELREKGFVSQSALDAKEAAFKAAAAQAGAARNQVGYTHLVADRAGIVAATFAEVGQVVGAGQAIVKLAEQGEREVVIAIPESRYGALKVGMPAEVELIVADTDTRRYTGRLRELAPAADPISRTYPAKVTLTDADENVVLGMTARVRFKVMTQANGFIVPVSAIFQQGDRAAVWLVEQDGRVSLRPVSIAAYRDEGALITAGVSAGERIVSAGVHKLTVGDKVKFTDIGSRP